MKPALVLLSILFLVSCAAPPARTGRVDPQLAGEIAKIKAIDNHAHPVRALNEGEHEDEYDALPVENMEPSSESYRLRPESGDMIPAWKDLFGYRWGDRSAEHLRWLTEQKKSVMREKGDGYPAWVLDKLGIETMLANRVAMGRGIAPPRFLWVPYADALLFPLDNSRLAAANPDRKLFFPLEDKLRARYLKDSGLNAVPATLDEYLQKVITATLERQKQGGAVAEKFELSYLRPLDIGNPPQAAAAVVYAKYAKGGVPPDDEYKTLQDFLFRYIARECGRLGLAVHFHSAAGAGGYFDVRGVNPMYMEPLIDDPSLRKTNFVFVHGGWPYTRELTALLTKPNAYLDFSAQTFLLYANDVAGSIREWLEYVPEKVMYGTDAYPFSAEMGWEEAGWVANETGREALGIALTGMMRDNEITFDKAVEMARMVLRDNARKLYALK